jgi:uncharacterized membrane-anchored protein YitT (DUF2179 family)
MAHVDRKLTPIELLQKFIFITLGAVLMALALEVFLVPNEIIDGGITGVSIILSKVTPISLGIFIFVLNLPFFWAADKSAEPLPSQRCTASL